MSILVRENALSNSEPYPIQSPLLGVSWEISLRSSISKSEKIDIGVPVDIRRCIRFGRWVQYCG